MLSFAFPFAAAEPAQTKSQNHQTPLYEDHRGYEVLSLLLNKESEVWKNDEITINSRTAYGRDVASVKNECSNISSEFRGASADFDGRSKTKLLLRTDFSLKKPYKLVFARHTAAVNRYHSGTYYLAPVGFDERRTRAIAFVEYICGRLCGSSILHFFRKTEKGWEEAQDVRACGRIY
jgi:hypothetical protein